MEIKYPNQLSGIVLCTTIIWVFNIFLLSITYTIWILHSEINGISLSICMVLFSYIIYSSYHTLYIFSKISSAYALYKKIETQETTKQTFYGAQHTFEEIGEYIKILVYICKSKVIRYLCRSDARDEIYAWVDSIIDGYIAGAQDLRSDLTTRLTEQQVSLESAKSEVEKNLTGTPELLAVSELQKTRLDRQIEQFEELQRMLVKA